MEKHVEELGAVEKSVRVATRSLAERRQQVEAARARISILEQQAERADNARRALDAAETEWTGRTPLRAEVELPPAFGLVPPPAPAPSSDSPTALTADPPIPAPDAEDALVQLRRLAAWEDRVAALLEERAAALEGDGADRAIKYRKVIALCAKVSVDQVDSVSRPKTCTFQIRMLTRCRCSTASLPRSRATAPPSTLRSWRASSSASASRPRRLSRPKPRSTEGCKCKCMCKCA